MLSTTATSGATAPETPQDAPPRCRGGSLVHYFGRALPQIAPRSQTRPGACHIDQAAAVIAAALVVEDESTSGRPEAHGIVRAGGALLRSR
jgi:hypothetical protein